jgi:ketopantoate hydroxymethyltransferase
VPSNDYATACSNSLHTLRLADSKGACPGGYSHIDLASAPTALTVNASDRATHDETVNVANFAFTAVCGQNKAAQEVAVLVMKSATGFDVKASMCSPAATTPSSSREAVLPRKEQDRSPSLRRRLSNPILSCTSLGK